MGNDPPVVKPTYPASMTGADMDFDKLMDVFVADNVYFGIGSYAASDISTKYDTQGAMATELSTNFDRLGELAEKPGKTDSKLDKHRTRNYLIPGKRTNTVELNIAGLSNAQKDYLESHAFMGKDTTIVVASKGNDRAVIFNGLRWTVDWSAEADDLFNVIISTEFSGVSLDNIFVLKDIPVATQEPK